MITPATIAVHLGSDIPVLIHRVGDECEVRGTVLDLVQIARSRLRGAGYVCRPIIERYGLHRFRVTGWRARP